MSNAGFKAAFADENNKELVIKSVKRAFTQTNLQFSPFEPQSTKVPFANRNKSYLIYFQIFMNFGYRSLKNSKFYEFRIL